MMKTFRMTMIAAMTLLLGAGMATSCSDANEYEDTNTDNPSWVNNYTDSLTIGHPDSLTSTKWVRALGQKTDAYGKEVLGFVESIDIVSADSVAVKMSDDFEAYVPTGKSVEDVISEGSLNGTWTDESNTASQPYYEYTYSAITGKLEILKLVKDEKGNISKSAVFVGIATSGTKEVLTVVHYGDTPVQTYLVKQ